MPRRPTPKRPESGQGQAEGLSAATARTVATELTSHGAFAAHLDAKLHIDPADIPIQDRLGDPADRPDPRPAPPPGHFRRQVRDDHLPLRIGQVTGIASGLPSGPAPTLGTRGPCLPGRHTSGSWGPRLLISTGRVTRPARQARRIRPHSGLCSITRAGSALVHDPRVPRRSCLRAPQEVSRTGLCNRTAFALGDPPNPQCAVFSPMTVMAGSGQVGRYRRGGGSGATPRPRGGRSA
jgi:hypothetical protein